MRRRWRKRLSMVHVYRTCRYVFRAIGVYGFYLGLHHASIADGFIQATDIATKAVFVIAASCMALAVIGDLRFEYLEKAYIQEQREEERRALKSAQERELQKGA